MTCVYGDIETLLIHEDSVEIIQGLCNSKVQYGKVIIPKHVHHISILKQLLKVGMARTSSLNSALIDKNSDRGKILVKQYNAFINECMSLSKDAIKGGFLGISCQSDVYMDDLNSKWLMTSYTGIYTFNVIAIGVSKYSIHSDHIAVTNNKGFCYITDVNNSDLVEEPKLSRVDEGCLLVLKTKHYTHEYIFRVYGEDSDRFLLKDCYVHSN